MGKNVHSRTAHTRVYQGATSGGRSATAAAEQRVRQTKKLDPMVDPKGPAHLGPVRLSLPRFEQRQDGLFVLTLGMPMPEETLLDTTGSMRDNVDIAMRVLLDVYEAYTTGRAPVLGRYDVQMATGVFGDVQDLSVDDGKFVLCRSQFEMGEKISEQMTLMVPSRNGCGNRKEDPQYGIFGAAYLTRARIWEYGLRSYHFTVTDEPVDENIDLNWLMQIFGDDVLKRLAENGHNFTARSIPDLAATVKHLLTHTHAFLLQVPGWGPQVRPQWERLYGSERVIQLPDGTAHLHLVKAVIVGLTEGVIDLESAHDFLIEHGASKDVAERIVYAVSNIPLSAQTQAENFYNIPVAGDVFRKKTDLWPMTDSEIAAHVGEDADEASQQSGGGVNWI